ncbi:MAG: hypothetical protein ACFE0P_08040 [Oceanicaulis sp.]
MTMKKRLQKLEQTRPDPVDPPALELPADLVERLEAAKAAGTFPQGLSNADLSALMAARRQAENER